jgi:MFS family permease
VLVNYNWDSIQNENNFNLTDDGTKASYLSLLSSSYYLGNFFGSLLSSQLASKNLVKSIVIIMAVQSLTFLGFSILNIYVMCACRFLHGILGSMCYVVSQWVLPGIAVKSQKGMWSGLLNFTYAIGAMVSLGISVFDDGG